MDLSKDLKKMASRMNGWKANILPIAEGKKPVGEWKEWMTRPQTISDLTTFDWDRLRGIGLVSGISGWRVIDIDHVKDKEVLKSIIRKLGLPEDYKWIVLTGSREGYHIYVRTELDFPSEALNRRRGSIYFFKSSTSAFDHLELRWSNCQTLMPPSLHPSENRYEFLNGQPTEAPGSIDVSRVIDMVKEFCIIEDDRKDVPEEGKPAASEGESDDDLRFIPSAIEHLAERLVDYNDWFRCGMALASLGEQGRQYFLDLSLKNKNYKDTPEEINKKFDSFLKDKSNSLQLNTLFHIAKNYDYQYPRLAGNKKKKKDRSQEQKEKAERGEFWYESFVNDHLQLCIDRANFLSFLQKNGYCKMYVGNDYIFIQITNNIVREVTVTHIKDFILNYIKTLPDQLTQKHSSQDLYNLLLKGSNVYFATSFLEFLEHKVLTFHRDTIHEAYFYFKNCWVQVTRDNYYARCYEELGGYIWERQILERNFTDIKENLENYQISEFQVFLRNVCNEDNDRYYSLKSALGYLLHTYKDSSNAKAIIFCDEQLGEEANGRSGKSLMGNAISRFRNSVRFDGRNFKQDKNFAFQQVGLDTQIMEFNDVDKKFNFERLFSILTDSISIEKKNKDEFIIPFEKSPKVLISTNYTIQTDGDSADDRKFEIEFSNHYNKDHKPVDEFGHRFFDEWDESEWNRFDNFMIGCVNYFLQKGLKPYSFVNLNTKKLLQSTSKEFIEYMDNEVKPDTQYNKKSVYDKFLVLYPDYSAMKQNKFAYWLKKYAKTCGYKYDEYKGHSERYFCMILNGLSKSDDNAPKLEEMRQSQGTFF